MKVIFAGGPKSGDIEIIDDRHFYIPFNTVEFALDPDYGHLLQAPENEERGYYVYAGRNIAYHYMKFIYEYANNQPKW